MKVIRSTASISAGAAALCCFLALATRADPPPAPSAPPPAAALTGACKQDLLTLCSKVQPGEGRIAACLKSNRGALSAGCKEAIRAHHREHAETPSGARSDPGTPTAVPPSPSSAPPPKN